MSPSDLAREATKSLVVATTLLGPCSNSWNSPRLSQFSKQALSPSDLAREAIKSLATRRELNLLQAVLGFVFGPPRSSGGSSSWPWEKELNVFGTVAASTESREMPPRRSTVQACVEIRSLSGVTKYVLIETNLMM